MTYGYVRVSTREQIVDRQLVAMKTAGVADSRRMEDERRG